MNIQGIQRVTLLDFPGRVACTVFISGCNFRCPFCHNASLLTANCSVTGGMSDTEFFDFLDSRKNKLDGVCITGGEPLLHPEIRELILGIRNRGFSVKLDTNGTNPELMNELMDEDLLDYVAMDIKNAPDSYGPACGLVNPPMDLVEQSVRILLSGKVPFEFRTTVVEEFHNEEEIRKIASWIQGSPRYYLQEFVDSGDVIREGLHACPPEKMEILRKAAADYIPATSIRGE